MLMLARKVGEGITIRCPNGDELKVSLTEIRGTIARLGIAAPSAYAIYRDELRNFQRRDECESRDR